MAELYTCRQCGATSPTMWIEGGVYFCSSACEEKFESEHGDAAPPELAKPNVMDALFDGFVTQYFATQEAPERWQAEIYAQVLCEAIDDQRGPEGKSVVVARAMGAAQRCEIEDPPIARSPLQERALRIGRDIYINKKPNAPNLSIRANAFGRMIAEPLDSFAEQRALSAAKRGFISRPSVEEKARERAAEFERNRPRPPKKAIYPV